MSQFDGHGEGIANGNEEDEDGEAEEINSLPLTVETPSQSQPQSPHAPTSSNTKGTKIKKKIHHCQYCASDKLFSTINDLKRHQKTVHGLVGPGDKIWLCQIAGCSVSTKIWVRPYNFKQHIHSIHGPEHAESAESMLTTYEPARHGPIEPSKVKKGGLQQAHPHSASQGVTDHALGDMDFDHKKSIHGRVNPGSKIWLREDGISTDTNVLVRQPSARATIQKYGSVGSAGDSDVFVDGQSYLDLADGKSSVDKATRAMIDAMHAIKDIPAELRQTLFSQLNANHPLPQSLSVGSMPSVDDILASIRERNRNMTDEEGKKLVRVCTA